MIAGRDGDLVFELNKHFGRDFERTLVGYLERHVAPKIIRKEEQLAPVGATGRLSRGFRHQIVQRAGDATPILLVYNEMFYADAVERGHGHVAPRPFARPALEEVARL